jgi:hypothetical protein
MTLIILNNIHPFNIWCHLRCHLDFHLTVDLTLGVNAPWMSYVITMIDQFIIIEVVEFEKTSDS